MPKRFDYLLREDFWRNEWETSNIYSRSKNQTREKSFVIDSPPPTVSGSLHVGHIFSYTHQDIIARYKRMQNFNVVYPMGWDDNGLPTERRVQNIFGVRIDNNVSYIENLNVEKEKKRSPKKRTQKKAVENTDTKEKEDNEESSRQKRKGWWSLKG